MPRGIRQFVAHSAMTFGAVNSDRVAGPTPGGVTKFSVGAWVAPTTLSGNKFPLSRLSAGGLGWQFGLQDASGNLILRWGASTTAAAAISNTLALATNVWRFIGGTMDQSAGTMTHLYMGGLATPMAEPGYSTHNNGVGTWDSDSANQLIIGNRGSLTGSWVGNLWAPLYFPNVVLTLADFDRLRARTMAQLPGANALVYYDLGADGAGPQRDLSGNGNTGTVTGAVALPGGGPPLPQVPFHRRGRQILTRQG